MDNQAADPILEAEEAEEDLIEPSLALQVAIDLPDDRQAAKRHLEALGDDATEKFGAIRESIASLLDEISARAKTMAERLHHEAVPPAR